MNTSVITCTECGFMGSVSFDEAIITFSLINYCPSCGAYQDEENIKNNHSNYPCIFDNEDNYSTEQDWDEFFDELDDNDIDGPIWSDDV